MNLLSKVLAFKIAFTLIMWCGPMLLFPATWLEAIGLPPQQSYLFIRLLGWAYLALCVGYGFAFFAALEGERLMAIIWMGLVSNGGACLYLIYFGTSGSWSSWGIAAQIMAWSSVAATAIICMGLFRFGIQKK